LPPSGIADGLAPSGIGEDIVVVCEEQEARGVFNTAKTDNREVVFPKVNLYKQTGEGE